MTTKLPSFIEDIEDYSETINILCHGDTGAGKTRLWSRLPRLVIIATEPGAVSAKKAGVHCKVIRAGSWPKIVEAYQWIRDNPGEFDWILFDSITKAQALCIRHIMQMVVKANSSRDPLIPSQGDHFKWQLSMKQLVMDFNELPENMVWLARSMNKENPDGDDIVVPLIEGKDYGISAWVCGEVGLLCYLKKETKGKGASAKVVRKLYTNEHSTYWCKDWYDVLPHVVEFTSDVGVAEKLIKMIVDSETPPKSSNVRPAKKAAATKRKA